MIRRSSPLLAVLTSSALLGCQSGQWVKDEELARSVNLRVELEHRTGEESVAHAHPAKVDPLWLGELFADLSVEKSGLLQNGAVDPIVHEKRREVLANAIAAGLSSATPGQRVRFAVENPDRALGLFPSLNMTRGVAFVDAQQELNLVFDLVRSSGDESIGQWGDPTRRRVSRAELILPPMCRLHVDSDGDPKPLWVVTPLGSRRAFLEHTAVDAEGRENLDPRRAIQIEFLDELYREGLLGERAYREKRLQLESGEER